MINEAINIKQSTAAPAALDTGNSEIQGRVVSKTIQMALFTNNQNAVHAGAEKLRRESFPFAQISFPANRDIFRYEVGDCFKLSYTKYGISNMICRVLQIQEDGPESENITITAMEDIFAVVLAITEYLPPGEHSTIQPSYFISSFENQKIYELPYALSSQAAPRLIAPVCRMFDSDLGFGIYMSIDGGNSYQLIGRSNVLVPHGVIIGDYPEDTYSIDADGFIVAFTDDENQIETATFAQALAGMANTALLGDEIISFQSITPISGTQYQLGGVIRGRYGTQKAAHLSGDDLYYLGSGMAFLEHAEIIPGAARKFKYVPYNLKFAGAIADSVVLDLAIIGKSITPYIPINFTANGGAFAARYDADIVLSWSPRYRGRGAGIGLPGIALPDATREGLFKIEVWVGGVLKRTVGAIDAATWTYTEAMNIADNGSLAAGVTFKLSNYLTVGAQIYESDQVEVMCKKN